MKKIILILLLLVAASGFAQQKGLPFWNSAFSTNAAQYFSRYDVKPTGDTLKWYAEFIDSLTLNGDWALIDEMWIYANNTSANSLIGVKGYKNSTGVNSPTFTAYRGFAGNGTTSYINTNYNPSLNKVSLTANSISYGAYSRTNVQNARAIIGSIGASPNRYMYIYPYDNSSRFYYSTNTTTDIFVSNTGSQGLFVGNRSDASNGQAYKNGVQLANVTSTASTLNDLNIYVCCQNQNGSASDFTTRQIAFAFVGASMTVQQQLNLYNCLQRLLTKIGANV